MMNRILFTLLFFTQLLVSLTTKADNVILMIGDGMGINHINCANAIKPMYLLQMPTRGTVTTKSADSLVTDSAASATAYACGKKTKNHYLGILPNGEKCLTIAEEAVQKGFASGIYSTDNDTGATPSAFYAHVQNRGDSKQILEYKKKAESKMDILLSIKKLSSVVDEKLSNLKQQHRPYFVMFEGAYIDKESHNKNYEGMIGALQDFDDAVYKVTDFVSKNPDTTLIVLADHETGGLRQDCRYTTNNHTGKDVSVFAFGKNAYMFQGKQDNTEINEKIRTILFSK